MILRLWKRPAPPEIPDPPVTTDRSDELEQLRQKVRRQRVHSRMVLFKTDDAVDRNHFAANIKKAMEA